MLMSRILCNANTRKNEFCFMPREYFPDCPKLDQLDLSKSEPYDSDFSFNFIFH